MAIDLFDANFYRAANSDLAGFSNTQALSHFQAYGLNEGRTFSPLVNLNFYRANNSDLAQFNNQQLFNHLQNFGVAEGRRFSQFVDLNFYRSNNSDLTGFSNEQIFGHLNNFGVAEGRRFSQFVDLNFYRSVNSDLTSFNNKDLLQHLQVNGTNEGRQFSQFFDVNYYRENNPDLTVAGLKGVQILEHFQLYGLDEGRRFNVAFDVNSYRSLYPDLVAVNFNNRQLFEHFQIFGLNEGRISSPAFNVKVYLANNSDLIAANFNNQQAYTHFLTFGQREGRPGSDYAGNTIGAARDISGLLESTWTDFVGDTDTNDYYKFNLESATNLTITLDSLSANANLQLIWDANNNGVVDAGEAIETSANNGTNSEAINRRNLAAGTYYIKVDSGQVGANTNYNLKVSSFASPEIVAYDRSSGGLPITQGWLFFGTVPTIPPFNLGNLANQTISDGGTNLVSTDTSVGGYSNYNQFSQMRINSQFPTLDRNTGYTIHFDVQINSESHTNNDQAGFSVTVLGSDRQGIELGFWTDEIWAKETGTALPPNGTLFTHDNDERAFRDTTRMTRYELSVLGNSYQLFANGSQILTGNLRDYSVFNHRTLNLAYDPYETRNYLFLGDNATSAGADINLKLVGVTTA